MLSKQKVDELFYPWKSFMESFQNSNQDPTKAFFESLNFKTELPSNPMSDVFMKAYQAFLNNPDTLAEAHQELLDSTANLWQNMLNQEKNTQEVRDKRFHHQAWQTNPYFRFIKDYYFETSKWLEDLVLKVEGLDEETIAKVQFFTKQYIDAMSPTNFPMTNPEVLEEIGRTNGDSLKKGLENFLEDMATGKGIQLTDPTKFILGETIACTKGDVVFRNELFELIHYKPLTKKQYSTPMLIIPPWINKYYIFDLSPHNSFVKWMLEAGHNVFIISWVNPGPELGDKSFEDYVFEGAYRAADFITTLNKSKSINTMGYCIGGNLLVALAAYLAKNKAPFSLQTMTLLATIIDFEKVGDLKIFMDKEHLSCIEESMFEKGFLDSEDLKSFFNMLRPNDLIWSFFVKNYLLGQIPPAFDFLYWNSDSTRLPANLHSFICRKFFQENLLLKSRKLNLKGSPLDVRDVTTPTFILSTLDDHIAPWKSSYPLTELFKGPLKFVLGTSGHVAGVINPPERNKYSYFENGDTTLNSEEWLEKAHQTKGSWWTAWQEWVAPQSGQMKSPLNPYYSLEFAPGSYVKKT